jgi:hypothetical protein
MPLWSRLECLRRRSELAQCDTFKDCLTKSIRSFPCGLSSRLFEWFLARLFEFRRNFGSDGGALNCASEALLFCPIIESPTINLDLHSQRKESSLVTVRSNRDFVECRVVLGGGCSCRSFETFFC